MGRIGFISLVLLTASSASSVFAQTIPTPIRDWAPPRSEPVSGSMFEQMQQNGSWSPNPGRCPLDPSHLRMLKVTHLGFDGGLYEGKIIVHEAVVNELSLIFTDLYLEGFAIDRMIPGLSDRHSMSINNSSGFDCGYTEREDSILSLKSYGMAIDLNPRMNPYVRPVSVQALDEFWTMLKFDPHSDKLPDRLNDFCVATGRCQVIPPDASPYLKRDSGIRGSITHDGTAYKIFQRHGWSWGGDWPSTRGDKIRSDYQRFERRPR